MPYKVIVDHPTLGETDLFIQGLGTFSNHTETEIPDERIDLYRASHATVDTKFDKNGNVSNTPKLGPDPVELEFYGVRVEKVSESENEEQPNEGSEEASE